VDEGLRQERNLRRCPVPQDTVHAPHADQPDHSLRTARNQPSRQQSRKQVSLDNCTAAPAPDDVRRCLKRCILSFCLKVTGASYCTVESLYFTTGQHRSPSKVLLPLRLTLGSMGLHDSAFQMASQSFSHLLHGCA